MSERDNIEKDAAPDERFFRRILKRKDGSTLRYDVLVDGGVRFWLDDERSFVLSPQEAAQLHTDWQSWFTHPARAGVH